MSRAQGIAVIAMAAILWGTAGTVQEMAVADASPLAVAAARAGIGGGVLLVVAAVRHRDALVTLLTEAHHRRAVVAATVAMLVFQVGYLGGIRLTGVAVGALVAIGSAPVWAGVFAAVTGRTPSPRWWVGTTVAIVGLALLVAPGLLADTAATGVDLGGVLLAAAAGAGYAGYATATAPLAGRVDAVAVVAVVFTLCGAVLLFLPAGRAVGTLDATGLAGHAWLAAATVVAAYLLFARGLTVVDPPTATTVTLAEPVTATTLAILVVGERLGVIGGLGVVTILAGLAVAGRTPVGPHGRG